MNTSIATVQACQLHRLLSDVAPFRGTDDTIPVCTAVHVESDGKRIIAVTTDRYTIAVSRLDIPASDSGHADHGGVPHSFNLSPQDVSMLLKISKTIKRDWHARFVSLIENADATIEFIFLSGERITCKPMDVQFVQWRHLIPQTGTTVPRASTGLCPEYVARFAKVAQPEHGSPHMRMFAFDNVHGYDGETQKSQRPLAVTIGDNFIGLIMPVKLAEDEREYQRPDWID